MKKILSLLLAVSMLISVMSILSSCGDDEQGQNNPPKQPETRYTVTEEEWNSNMQAVNYTLDGKYIITYELLEDGILDVYCSTVLMKMNENAVSTVQERQGQGRNETISLLQVINDESCLNVYKNLYTGKYEAIDTVAEESQWTVLGEVVYSYGISIDIEGLFSEFTYDEPNKCYVYSLEESDDSETTVTVVSISFFNGSVTGMKIEKINESEGFFGEENYEFKFQSIGTTVVEIPEYTVVE